MNTASRSHLIDRLASAVGIEGSYRSTTGLRVRSSEAAKLAILGALGYEVRTERDLNDAVAERSALDRRLAPAVCVIRVDERPVLTIAVARATALRNGSLRIRDELGEELSVPLRRLAPTSIEGDRHSLDLSSLELGVGRYSMTIEIGAEETRSVLLVRPGKARRPERSYGVIAPLYGLRAANDLGIGSTTELERFGRWVADHGGSFVGTLPLYPAFYDAAHFEVSPYRPVSRVAWNEIYLDPAKLPEFAVGDAHSEASTRRAPCSDGSSVQVDYEKVTAVKRPLLELCAAAVARGPRRKEFATFLAERPEATAYARFRAKKEGGSAKDLREATRYHEYGQFAMDAALDSVVVNGGVPLYLDLPLGVHPDGFDPAYYSSAFLKGVSMGAPPDDFFSAGQNWGIPPLHPEGLREQSFGYVTATYRHLFRHASVVRFDHVMGFERCFVIPDGADPGDGVYLRYPSDELRAIAAIEADRAGVTLVGEDLGTVAPKTRSAMRRDGMLRSAVYQMESSADDPEPSTPAGSLASFGTHDLPRFAEYLAGGELTTRVADGALSRTEAAAERSSRRALRRHLESLGNAERGIARAYRGFLAWLASTEADLALVDLGDLFGDVEPENRPGPQSGARSWRHRLSSSLEELESNPRYASRLSVVAEGRPKRAEASR